jgi:hypothetical protein
VFIFFFPLFLVVLVFVCAALLLGVEGASF